MSEHDMTTERAERGNALDRFARSDEPATSRAVIPQQAFAVGGDRIIGAQEVAVHRDEARVLSRIRTLAAAAGTDWTYRFPVKNRKAGRTDWIEGPSVKLANDLARTYGNCDVSVQVADLGDAWMIYARFTDYETGFTLQRPFQQSKGASRLGGEDDARRLDIALQIGASKAIRNVVCNALQTFADYAYEEARGSLVEKIGAKLGFYRLKIADRLAEMRVELARVEVVRGRTLEQMLAPDLAKTIAEIQAVADGMASTDETWPELVNKAPAPEPTAALDQFAAAEPPASPPASVEAETAEAAADPAEATPAPSQAIPDTPERARERGYAAFHAGAARRAIPGEYRSTPLQLEWQDGFDAARKEQAST